MADPCRHRGEAVIYAAEQDTSDGYAWVYHHCKDCGQAMARYLIPEDQFLVILDLKNRANVLLDRFPDDVKSLRTESVSGGQGWGFIKYANKGPLGRCIQRFRGK